MHGDEGPIHGRGTASNPANRFEPIAYERAPDDPDPDDPAPATQFYKDHSRSIIATNDSPDVGFDASINPYRGCEHGCVYCLSGDTPILMANGSTRRLDAVQVGQEIYGTARSGWYRHYTTTTVLAHWSVTRAAYRVRLEDGTCLTAGGDHRFLTERGWKYVSDLPGSQRPHLTVNNKLMGIGALMPTPPADDEFARGYLCGVIRGDGLLGTYKYDGRRRGVDRQYHFRLALIDDEALTRSENYLRAFGISTHRCLFQTATSTRAPIAAIRTHARRHVDGIRELIAWPSEPGSNWRRGFLSGIFDAEGSYSSGGILRLCNTDRDIVDRIVDSFQFFGFGVVREPNRKGCNRPVMVIRLAGGLRQHLRFFHTVDNAISRKRSIEGQAVKSSADLRVASIEPLGIKMPLFDLTTGTGDFIANGVISHNCYARPTHEYLGLSAGLDFETKIFVKEDAPHLLRRELLSPRWQPQTLGFSGVTDAYQPIERRLQLTRRCLEVLADFRNPVAVITKNRLVTRDLDLLGKLARHDAAALFLSVTTLDGSLARVMEPRATQPQGRLAAIEAAAAAGVPVGVLVAPVIPGLNDHEIPAILTACAEAGARFAGCVILRLPHAVASLFEAWLGQHFPERKDKVLGRIRDLRGGRLNDARFGSRMRGEGVLAQTIKDLFTLACRKAGIHGRGPKLSTAAFRRPGETQGLLFAPDDL